MSSETYQNAPLAIVIAQVKHSPVAAASEYFEALQTQFRKTADLPEYKENITIANDFRIEGDGNISQSSREIRAWEYFSADRTRSVLVDGQSVSLMYSPVAYKNWKGFKGDFEKVATTVLDLMEVGYVHRIGMRYVDHVRPDKDQVFDYVVENFKPFEAKGLASKSHTTRTDYALSGGGKASVIFRLGVDQRVIDENLRSSTLNLDFGAALKKGECAVDADTSMTYENPLKYERNTLMESMEALHISQKTIFETVTTKLARADWKGEQP